MEVFIFTWNHAHFHQNAQIIGVRSVLSMNRRSEGCGLDSLPFSLLTVYSYTINALYNLFKTGAIQTLRNVNKLVELTPSKTNVQIFFTYQNNVSSTNFPNQFKTNSDAKNHFILFNYISFEKYWKNLPLKIRILWLVLRLTLIRSKALTKLEFSSFFFTSSA